MISRVEKFPYSDKDVTLKELTEALSKENFELYKQKKDKYFFRRIFSNKFSSAILPRLLVHYGVVVKFKQSVVVIMGLPTRIRRVKALVFGQSPSFPGFWQRFSAAFLDFCLIVVINALTVLLFGKFLALKYSIYFAVVTYLVLLWLYFSLLESSPLQATLGKYHVLGLKVTDTNGNRISFGRATARFWLKIISALPLFMGFIMVGLTKKKRALHDILSGCIVNYK
jgi:uncharacterized RDD family membrane protein YckC